MGYWVIPNFHGLYKPLSSSQVAPSCANSNKSQLISGFILAATHKQNTGVSISTVYISLSLTQRRPVGKYSVCVEMCLPQLPLIFHTSVWRVVVVVVVGGRFVVNSTQNTWLPLGRHSWLWVFKQKTLFPFSGHTLCPDANFRAVCVRATSLGAQHWLTARISVF